ncbi:hypothetical protein [Microvirga tunisiensis]|uniref:Uncharacterized protein n=1 Tax=Microvirga tunisiensis TaxID=2108360 RepID=A0A5N7MBL8_9HYPH|nr:hypothetical protein [Microvirga tunisiensis]MPR06312.1 hypothetical protein [Microvirga tunisiensis]MPR24098.1 hypothetical protein [Microvirga tunisiensis]
MAKETALLKAYERMLETQDHKKRLAPDRLVTLIADAPWIEAVSAHTEARQAFLEAAITFCASIRNPEPKGSRRAARKDRFTENGREERVS